MRLPHNRTRRQSVSCFLSFTAASLLLNFVLAAALLLLYTNTTELPSIDRRLNSEQLKNHLEILTEQVQNVSSSLEAALVSLQEKGAELATVKENCHMRSEKEQKRAAALEHEAEVLRQRVGELEPPKPRLAEREKPSGKLWLTIGIPTIPRRNKTDYLTRTLSSLFEELPLDPTDLLFKRVKVLVMNNRPGEHPVWEEIRDKIFGASADQDSIFARKGRLYAEFMDNPGSIPDPTPGAIDPDDSHNPKNRPGREVRRQTCDLISLLETVQPLSTYYVFMEDDFRVCPNMLRILSYSVRKLNTVPGYGRWLGLRFSYGMNGVLLHNEDLTALTAYLRKHTARLPPDLLWTEWIMGQRIELRLTTRGRRLAVFRHNLLDHIGARSSFTVRANRPEWPRCYHPMSQIWSLGKREKFNELACSHSDLWPCPRGDGGEIWTKYPVQWPRITEGMDLDHPPLPQEEQPPPANQTLRPMRRLRREEFRRLGADPLNRKDLLELETAR